MENICWAQHSTTTLFEYAICKCHTVTWSVKEMHTQEKKKKQKRVKANPDRELYRNLYACLASDVCIYIKRTEQK